MALLSLALLGPSQTTTAQTNRSGATPRPRPAAVTESKARPIPFRGKIVAVDKKAATLTVGQRTFQVTPQTKVQKDGVTAGLESAAAGDYVTGSYVKAEDGKLVARSLYVGARAASNSKSARKPES